MPTVTEEQVTAPMIRNQREFRAISPMRTTVLQIPRRRSPAWLSLLQTFRVPFIKRRQQDMRGINPDALRHETLADHMARTEPYLYLHALCG